MDPEKLIAALAEKMRAEQDKYRAHLLTQSPEKIGPERLGHLAELMRNYFVTRNAYQGLELAACRKSDQIVHERAVKKHKS